MQTLKRVTPWMNRKEYEEVYRDLFSGNRKRQLRGVLQIDVWRSRVLNRLPVAIDSTAALVRASIDHQEAQSQFRIPDVEYRLRNTYSMALIRLVNHITEKGQTKQYAQPIHVLAEEFGLPEWIVELRHAATHGHLPSISVLAAATRWAINWLKIKYWHVQLEGVICVSDEKEEEEDNDPVDRLRKILTEYSGKKLKLNSASGSDKSQDELTDILGQILPSRAVTCILEDGFLIPTNQQLKKLGIDETELMCSQKGLPDVLVQFWKPVLKIFHCHNLIPSLLLHLVSMTTDTETLKNRLMCGWVYILLTSNILTVKKGKKDKTTQVNSNRVELPVRQMLESCLTVPSTYTAPVIKRLLSLHKSQLCPSKVVAITKILDLMYNPSSPAFNETDNNDDITVHTLQEAISDFTPEDIEIEENGNQSIWQLCNDFAKWNDIPIGILPGQNLPTFSFNTEPHDVDTATASEEMDVSTDDITRLGTHRTMPVGTEFGEYNKMEDSISLQWTDDELHAITNAIQLLE